MQYRKGDSTMIIECPVCGYVEGVSSIENRDITMVCENCDTRLEVEIRGGDITQIRRIDKEEIRP